VLNVRSVLWVMAFFEDLLLLFIGRARSTLSIRYLLLLVASHDNAREVLIREVRNLGGIPLVDGHLSVKLVALLVLRDMLVPGLLTYFPLMDAIMGRRLLFDIVVLLIMGLIYTHLDCRWRVLGDLIVGVPHCGQVR
jgi:hypothetical protein